MDNIYDDLDKRVDALYGATEVAPVDKEAVEHIRQRQIKQKENRKTALREHAASIIAYHEQQPEVPEQGAPEENGIFEDVGRGAVVGLRDGVQEMVDAAGMLVNFVSGSQVFDTTNKDFMADFEGPQGTAGHLTKGVVQFLTGFIPAMGAVGKIGKVAGLAGKFGKAGGLAKSMAAGAIADATAFDPHEERLSNLIQDYPALANPITEFLAAEPGDTEMEGRLKNAIEGAGLGIAADAVFAGVRYLRGARRAKVQGQGAAAEAFEGRFQTLDEILDETGEATGEMPTGAAAFDQHVRDAKAAAEKAAQDDIRYPAVEDVEPHRVSREAELSHPSKYEKLKEAEGVHPEAELTNPMSNKWDHLKTAEDVADHLEKVQKAANVTLRSSNTVGSGIAGSVVGVGTDADGSGDVSMGDVLLGFLGGASLYKIGSKVLRAKDPEQGLKELKEERILQLDTYEKTLDERLASPRLTSYHRKKLLMGKEIVEQMRKDAAAVTDVATLKGMAKAPEVKKAWEDQAKPLVEIAEDGVGRLATAFTKDGFDGITREFDFNLDHIDGADAIEEVLAKTGDALEKEVFNAKRGVVSNEQTLKESMEIIGLGMDMDDLNALYQGMSVEKQTARVTAARIMMASTAEKMRTLAESFKGRAGDVTAAEALEFRRYVAHHSAIYAQVKGIQSEAARTLQAFNMKIGPEVDVRELDELLNGIGGKDKVVDAAKKFLDLTDEAQANQFALSLGKGKWKYVQEFYINALLSNPGTWNVNLLSNSLTTMWTPAEKMLAVGVSTVKGSGEHSVGELKAMLYGLTSSFTDALRLGADAFKKGEGQFDALQKVEGAQYKAFTSGNFGLKKDTSLAKGVDFFGDYIIRFPTRVLAAGDDFFKLLNSRMAIHEGAFRRANREATEMGLTGTAKSEYTAEVMHRYTLDPDPDLLAKGVDLARINTFTNPLTGFSADVQRAVSKMPVLRLFLPFIRTPTNIIKYVGDRTPILSSYVGRTAAELASPDKAIREMARARQVGGGLLYLTGFSLASQGLITGGGPKDKTGVMPTGWQPYSIKVGDTYYAYNRLDPMGMFLGIAADLHDLSGHVDDSDLEELTSMAMAALGKNLMSRSYIQGISNVVQALYEPERFAPRLLSGTAGAFVPAGVAQIARSTDPIAREAWGVMDKIKSRIPGYSQELPPRYNIFGETVTYGGGLGPDWASPIYTSKQDDDPVKNELASLEMDLRQSMSSMKKIGNDTELTPHEYADYVQFMGKDFYKRLERLFKSSNYKRAQVGTVEDKGGRQEMVSRVLSASKMRARASLLRKYPELKERMRERQMRKQAAW